MELYPLGSNPFSLPACIVVTPDNTTAVVINAGTAQVSICDIATTSVTGYVTGGTFDNPQFIATTPDSSTAYVTNFNNGTISIIDIATTSVTGTVNTSSFPLSTPYSIAIQP